MSNVLHMVLDATLVGISTGRLYQRFLGFLAIPEGTRWGLSARATVDLNPNVL